MTKNSRRMRRLVTATGVALVGALVLTGCATGGGSSKSAAGGELRIARSTDASSLDLTTVMDVNSIYPMQQVMEPLFEPSEDGSGVEPWLAKGYEASADGLAYTVTLRDDVRFSDGTPMTADDVKFSLDANSETGDAGWGYVNDAISEVKVVDEHTVEIDLGYQYAPLLATLSLFANAIVPKDYQGKSKEEFYEAPVGTGPFAYDTWQKGQSLKLKKNENYWQSGKPTLEAVSYDVVPESNSRVIRLQGGQADIAEAPDVANLETLKNTAGLSLLEFETAGVDYMPLNTKKAEFADEHVRRAIAMAIDKDSLVSTALSGVGAAANSMLMPGFPFYNENTTAPEHGIDQAKAELAQSGFASGFSTTLSIDSGNTTQTTVAQIIQENLGQIGITVDVQQVDPTTRKQQVISGEYGMTLSRWVNDLPDPDMELTYYVDADSGSNAGDTYYRDQGLIDLNVQAAKESDEAKRTEMYAEIQDHIAKASYVIPLYYRDNVVGVTDKVQGYKANSLGRYHLEDVTLTN